MWKLLTDEQVSEFMSRGITILREGFDPDVAARARARLWEEMGLDPNNPATWTEPFIHIQKTFSEPPFAEAISERVTNAFDDLLGEDRYHPLTAQGWWPVSFPGFEKDPWHAPEDGWHVDGIQFHHHVWSPTQALLPIFLYSDIAPQTGGTVISVGSHKLTARILRESEPDGLEVHELGNRVRAHPIEEVEEIHGNAGDVALLHPFILHARSPNTGNSVRFICNPCISFKDRMNLSRVYKGFQSPVELAIVDALKQAKV